MGPPSKWPRKRARRTFFLFGLTADQVVSRRATYNPHWHYENEPETRAALDLIAADHFSRNEPGIFAPLLRHAFEERRSLHAFGRPDSRIWKPTNKSSICMRNAKAWTRKAILNVASSGKFSSDRTIAEYAADIWNVEPCPLE